MDDVVIIFLIFVGIIILGVVFFNTPVGKGIVGETKVKRKFRSIKGKKYIFNNYLMLLSNGKTTEIDHIIICEKGVIVVETKNYSGKIFGNIYDEYFTQTLNFGKTKNKLYSPLKQNESHINHLMWEGDLDRCVLTGCVIFVQNNKPNVEGIYNLNEFKSFYKGLPKIFSEKNVVYVYNQLKSKNKKGIISRKEHIKNVKKASKN